MWLATPCQMFPLRPALASDGQHRCLKSPLSMLPGLEHFMASSSKHIHIEHDHVHRCSSQLIVLQLFNTFAVNMSCLEPRSKLSIHQTLSGRVDFYLNSTASTSTTYRIFSRYLWIKRVQPFLCQEDPSFGNQQWRLSRLLPATLPSEYLRFLRSMRELKRDL